MWQAIWDTRRLGLLGKPIRPDRDARSASWAFQEGRSGGKETGHRKAAAHSPGQGCTKCKLGFPRRPERRIRNRTPKGGRPFARTGMHEVQVGLSKEAGAADKKPDTEGIQKYKKKVYSLEKPWNTPSRQSGGRQITRRRGRRGKKQDPLHAGRRHRRSSRRHPPRPCGHRRSRCARTGRAPRWHRATGAATG